MKINAPILFHEIQSYMQVEFLHFTQNNYVKAPMFYNIFFNMDEHIVLLDASHLAECMEKVHHSILICTDVPEKIPDCTYTDNDLIILNDPLSDKMMFNVLNHILDRYNTWEQEMNRILYDNKSFQDLVEETTEILGLPFSLCDSDLRYIAFSKSSGKYIDDFVTDDNELTESASTLLRNRSDFKALEELHSAFAYTGAAPCICKNIFSHEHYVGRLAVIVQPGSDDLEFCKAIFDVAAPFFETLYSQYDSFSNYTMEYRKVHDFLHLIFTRQPADQFAFLALMNKMGVVESDRLYVLKLEPMLNNYIIYSSSFFCEHLERNFSGSFAVSLNGEILVLADADEYQRVTGKEFFTSLAEYLTDLNYTCGCSRFIHTLTVFEAIYFALTQARYTLDRKAAAASEKENAAEATRGASEDSSGSGSIPSGAGSAGSSLGSTPQAYGSAVSLGGIGTAGNPTLLHGISFFDEYALSYLIDNGCGGANYRQLCHPALLLLKDHDAKQNTSFLHTLSVYLECNMNAVAASKKLYIHRSSFINRMDRIVQLTEINLDYPMERLYLNLSLAAYQGRLEEKE